MRAASLWRSTGGAIEVDAAELTVVALGSNIDPAHNMEQALAHIARQTEVLAVSRFYRTPPLDGAGGGNFLNGAALLRTDLDARDLKFGVLRPIETALGRRRGPDRYAARTIDLDILYHKNETINEPGLQVPDPDLRTRPFLAAALLDVLPGAVLPCGTPVEALCSPGALLALDIDQEFTTKMQERYVQ